MNPGSPLNFAKDLVTSFHSLYKPLATRIPHFMGYRDFVMDHQMPCFKTLKVV